MLGSNSILAALVLLAPVLAVPSEKKLPTFIKPCKKNDPDLNGCIERNGQFAVPEIIKGDPKRKIPNLNPFEISELRINQGTKQVGMTMVLRNAKLDGLQNVKFLKSDTDLAKMSSSWKFMIPRLVILGDYEINGKVLLLPITGAGKANITLQNVVFFYRSTWKLENKNGAKHLKVTTNNIDFKAEKIYINLDNLFNGDKLLGDNMNRFLNENWEEVTKEVGPAIGDAFSNIIRNVIQSIADETSYDNIFI